MSRYSVLYSMWHVTPQHAIHFWHVTLYICHLSISLTCVYSHIIVSGAELGSYRKGGGTDPTEGQLLCEGGVHLSLSASPVRSRHLDEVVCVTWVQNQVSVPWDWTVTTVSPGQFSPQPPASTWMRRKGENHAETRYLNGVHSTHTESERNFI